ncbi:MAG: hypothetical protein R2813_09220 [Flavobacteriales bacterium]
MFEPLKYGLPFAVLQYALMVTQSICGLDHWTLLRWASGTGIIMLATVLIYRFRSNSGFSFRIAWFTGFNVLVASTLGFLGVHFLLSRLIIPSMAAFGGKELAYIAFQEFYGVMTIGLITLTMLSVLLRNKE